MDLHDFVISESKVTWPDQNTAKLGKDGATLTLKVPQNVALLDIHYRRMKHSGLKNPFRDHALTDTIRLHKSESDMAFLTGQSRTFKNREDYQEGANWVEDVDIWITYLGADVKPGHPEHPDPDPVDPGGGGGNEPVDPDPADTSTDDDEKDHTATYIAVAVAVGLTALLVLYLYLKKKKDNDE